MREVIVARNPVSGRCHVTRAGGLARDGRYGPVLTVKRVPKRVSDAELAFLAEKRWHRLQAEIVQYKVLAGKRPSTSAS